MTEFTRDEVTPFVNVFMGRSGTTYLIEALGSHPHIAAGFENLKKARKAGAQRQLDEARRMLTPPPRGQHAAIGFKTKLKDVLDPAGFAEVLRDVGARVIFQERKNVVKATISWSRAELLREVTGDWNAYRAHERTPTIEIDVDLFRRRLEALERGRERARQYVNQLQQPILSITYEDLLLHTQMTHEKVLSFLGVEIRALRAETIKNTSDDLRDAVSNFDELRAAFTGTRYEPMFDEVLVNPLNPETHVTRSTST